MRVYPEKAVFLPGRQTILGAGGVIANELKQELLYKVERVRLVNRHPTPPEHRMEAMAADLRDPRQTCEVLAGSEVAYLVAGLPHRAKDWEHQWPTIIDNVIEACKRHGVRLVYLDDLFAYGPKQKPLTEDLPLNPTSRMGRVKAELSCKLEKEMKAGTLQALIARGADFYGPDSRNRFIHRMVFHQLRDSKRALWLGRDDVKHAILFTPDAGRALAELGNAPDAFGQVWLLPVDPDPPTGNQLIREVACAFNTPPVYHLAGPKKLRVLAKFHPWIRESLDVLYHYTCPLEVDCRKFSQRFYPAMSWKEGVRITARCMKAPRA